MATTLAASVGALAGCSGDGDTTEAGATPTATETATETDTGSGGDETATATETATETETPTGPPVEDTAQSWTQTIPEQSFLYEYGESGQLNNAGISWVEEMCLPYREGTADFQTSGTTWDLGPMGEHEVMCWIEDYEIEAPFDWWETYDDRTTYWDGTPIDADAYMNDLEIAYYGEGLGEFEPGDKNYEKVGDWEIHHNRDRGEAEGVQASPANRFVIEAQDIGRYHPPPHPEFTQQWAEDMRAAESEDEANSLYSDLQSIAVTYFDFAKNGWGSGLYQLEDTDAVSNDTMQLTAREDHPNYREQTIDNIDLQVTAEAERQNILLNEGDIDVHQGVITETGQVTRDTLPDHIQQVSTTGAGAIFGNPLNWNGLLGNLWVRRAIYAAIDWPQVGGNAFGPNAYLPQTYNAGIIDEIAETWMSQDFLDQLHDWPYEQDLDLATEYMQRAGFTRDGDQWVSPDGEAAELVAKTASEYGQPYLLSVQTQKSTLDSFGIPVQLDNIPSQALNEARDNMSYDLTFFWNNQRVIFDGYTHGNGWWAAKFVERDPDFPNSYEGWGDNRRPDLEPSVNEEGEVEQEADEFDLRGQPLSTVIPTEVGNIEAPDEAGKTPNLDSAGVDYKEFNLMAHLNELNRDPDLTEDRLQTILQDLAWYANYYLNDFWPFVESTGVMANVRDYNWAPEEHAALKNSIRTGGTMREYQALSGFIFEKYDKDFEPP